MQEILREEKNFLIKLIDSATEEERLNLADNLQDLNKRLKSKVAKCWVEDIENYARKKRAYLVRQRSKAKKHTYQIGELYHEIKKKTSI